MHWGAYFTFGICPPMENALGGHISYPVIIIFMFKFKSEINEFV